MDFFAARALNDGMKLCMMLLLVAIFVSHLWMMLFAKSRLDVKSGDRSYDFKGYGLREKIGYFFGLSGLGFLFLLEANDHTASVPSVPHLLAYFIGATLYFSGFFLRLWAIRTLGRLFTFEIGIRQGHRLITEGPYVWFRHPSYTGYFFMAVGMATVLGYGRVLSALVIALPVLIFFAFRIPAEDKMLAAHFGVEYEAYAKKRWGLLPFL